MEKIDEVKQQLRRQLRAERKEIPQEEKNRLSRELGKRLCQLEQVQKARRVAVFISTPQEVQTKELMENWWEQGKEVYVPLCGEDGHMECVRIRSWEDVEEGKYGILAPKEHCLEAARQLDVILVPGLAFDALGYRIGYGGGYYDRYIARFEGAWSIGVCFDRFYDRQVPVGMWDHPVEGIVTERRTRICGLDGSWVEKL